MIHILLADINIRRDYETLRWPIKNMKRLKGRPVRVVFDDGRALTAALRELCAAGCAHRACRCSIRLRSA